MEISKKIYTLPVFERDSNHFTTDSHSNFQLDLQPYINLAEPILVKICIDENLLIEDITKQIHQLYDDTTKKQQDAKAIKKACLDIQKYQRALNLRLQIGIDEVGRGPLYGSVVIAGVVLPDAWSTDIASQPLKNTALASLTDSKKLTTRKREMLFPLICERALAYAVIDVPASVIDSINILQATLQGMRLACEHLMVELYDVLMKQPNKYEASFNQSLSKLAFELLIDGNKIPKLDWKSLQEHGVAYEHVQAEAWVKGDARHTAIAAASVLAKVIRDNQMTQDSLLYPAYGLAQHKGYPTKMHIEAIKNLGVLPKHRRSFRPIQEAIKAQSSAHK